MTGHIIVMRGLPGSGKTTAAVTLAEQYDAVRVSRDDIRLMAYATYHGGRIDEGYITRVETDMVKAALAQGRTVIVDAMHLKQSYINRWQKLGYPVSIHQIEVDWPTLVRRNSTRGAHKMIHMDVLETMWKKATRDSSGALTPVKLDPEQYETVSFQPLDLEHSWNKDDAFIFDIDGTLAHNDGHRSFYDYTKVYDDKVHQHVASVLSALEMDRYIIIVTGRPESALPETERWLRDNCIRYDEIHARTEKDGRADSLVKYEILRDRLIPRYNIQGVFDDRPSVCRMWRAVGIPTFQVGDPAVEF